MGKGGGATQTYDYYGTLAGGVCIGPNEDLIAIILNGQEVWPQGTPWAIGLIYNSSTLYVFDAQTWVCPSALNGATASLANAPGTGSWVEYTFPVPTDIATNPSDRYTDFSLTASDNTYYGVMRFYWGTQLQVVDPLLASTGNDSGVTGQTGYGDQHPDYEGITYVVIRDFLLGQEVQAGPNIEIVTRRKPNQSIITDAAAGITDGQANLAAVAIELLTDKNCLGLPAAMIDNTSFIAVADWLQTNQTLYGASVLIDTSETVPSLFDKLVQMFDGFIRFNPTTQKIELGVYPHGVTPSTYVTLTEDSFTKFPRFNSKSWQETISRATVRYNDRQINYQQTSLQVDDPRAFFVLGSVREQALDRPWIARQQQAMQHGRETLRVIGHAQLTGELEVRREIGRTIRAGDYVLVDIDLEPNANSLYQFFRVTARKIPPSGPITLTVFADQTLALVPWNGSGAPVIVQSSAVPAVTSFRFIEVPTALSGARGEIICLAQRPNNLISGAQLYFDTSSTGTFSSLLGQFANFAAKASLYVDITASTAPILVTVDPTQVDYNYFSIQTAANDQANDAMLLFLVQKVTSGGDTGQIDESAGYQIMEICSVGATALAGAAWSAIVLYAINAVVIVSGVQYKSQANGNLGNNPTMTGSTWWRPSVVPIYSLSVLRGRQTTATFAFAAATAEVWLMPKGLLNFFDHALFDQIRANRLAGNTPAYAQFRICPFTFVNSLALSTAVSEQFRFPLNSASVPSLALTAPTTWTLSYPSFTGSAKIPVAGTWTDPANGLVEIKVLLRASTDTADRVIMDQNFAATGLKKFSTNVNIDAAGTWLIKLIARDTTNITTERDITVSAVGSAKTCALPQMFDSAGNEVLDVSGSPQYIGSDPFVSAGWYVKPAQYIAPGPLTLRCSTPGAVIQFTTNGVLQSGTTLRSNYPGAIYSSTLFPFFMLNGNALVVLGPNNTQITSYPVNATTTIQVLVTAAGYAASAVTFVLQNVFEIN